MTEHCCVHMRCIDSQEATSLRDMLNVLNVKVADGYGAEFRKQAGETRLERMGYALERIGAVFSIASGHLILMVKNTDGILQTIAANVPICDLHRTCTRCLAEAQEAKA